MTVDPHQEVTDAPERDDQPQAGTAQVAEAEDDPAAAEAAAAEAAAAGTAAEIAQQAGETATAMLDAARDAAAAAVHTAEQTAQAAADVAALNVTEVALETAATAAAMVTAATDVAQQVAAADCAAATASPAAAALDITRRAAATAEAMIAAAAVAAGHAADRSRRDADAAADVAAQAVADIVDEAARTAAAMVAAAATAATMVASRAVERARHEAHAQGQADLLNTVLHGITDGIEVIDETGALLMYNRAAIALGVQHARHSIEGTTRADFGLFRPDGTTVFPSQDTPAMRALAGESSDDVMILARNAAHPHGVLLAVSGRPFKDATGHPRAVTVSRDVTAAHAQRTDLETFAAVAAHDLRAPLAIVTGYLEVIADLAVPELSRATADTLATVLRRAQTGTMRMSMLIDDLLHYATRDAALVIEDVDLQAQVDKVIAHHTEHLTPGTPAPGIFVGTLPPIRGDRARITQVLDNLIGNALKYTPPGQPAHLDITAQPVPATLGAEAQIQVQIGDRGIGIPPGQHAAIFTSFHRAHTTGPYDGTGLGLAICHRIVERHGGHIYATDNPGGGTRMRFTLPAAHLG